MSWRVIIRFSLDGDHGSSVRNNGISPLLRRAGITRTDTGTWESRHANRTEAAEQLADVMSLLADPSQVQGASSNIELDHLWIYIDRSDSQD